MPEKLINMESVEEIVEAVLFSSLVKGAVPLSVVLVAESGAAKSKLINKYQGKTIRTQDDLHTLDIHDILRKDGPEGHLRHIIIPDLNLPLSHKPQVARLTLATLLGPTSASSKFIFRIGNETRDVIHGPIGIVTACTPDIFSANSRKFASIGLIRRVPPIFYTMGSETVKRVRREEYDGTVTLQSLNEFVIKKRKPIAVKLPERYRETFETQADLFTSYLNVHVMKPRFHAGYVTPPDEKARLTEIAPQLYLQILAQAHAVRDRRNVVGDIDVEFVKRFVRFTNSSMPVAL